MKINTFIKLSGRMAISSVCLLIPVLVLAIFSILWYPSPNLSASLYSLPLLKQNRFAIISLSLIETLWDEMPPLSNYPIQCLHKPISTCITDFVFCLELKEFLSWAFKKDDFKCLEDWLNKCLEDKSASDVKLPEEENTPQKQLDPWTAGFSFFHPIS